MRLPWAIALFAFAASCEKTAPEPVAQRATSATSKSEPTAPVPASADPGRRRAACLVATPKSPAPSPAFRVDPKCPADPAHGSPMVPVGHVSFPDSTDAPRLEVELMLTNDHQQRGLMYRKSLADDKGMLFVWSSPTVHTFWMHNTCIPLDMIFIDRENFIAGIVENAPPLTDEGRSVDCPSAYVLEVNAGWSRKHGVTAGQPVLIEGVAR
jgi:uncharacterized membrane protein (UPF0127 family)